MLESDLKQRMKHEILKRFYPDKINIYESKKRSDPDWALLGPNGRWAVLEFKINSGSSKRPNQEFKIQELSKKGYAKIVTFENAEEVLNDLERLFSS
jgi:hypothetical protein